MFQMTEEVKTLNNLDIIEEEKNYLIIDYSLYCYFIFKFCGNRIPAVCSFWLSLFTLLFIPSYPSPC